MLKVKIKNLSDVDESLQEHYKQGSDGQYYLEASGDNGAKFEDVSGYEGKLGHIKNEQTALKEKNSLMQKTIDGFEKDKDTAIEAAKKEQIKKAKLENDVDTLTRGHEDSLSELSNSHKKELSAINSQLRKSTVGAEATRIAAEITLPDQVSIMTAIIARGLTMKTEDGNVSTIVVDSLGVPTGQSLDDYKKSFVTDAQYAPLLTGSKATGSGASGTGNRSGASGNSTNRSKMSFQDKNAYLKEHGQAKFLALPD